MRLRTFLSRGLLEPVFWRVKDLNVADVYYKFVKLQWDEPQVFKARQEEMLCKLLTHALCKIPFIGDFVRLRT